MFDALVLLAQQSQSQPEVGAGAILAGLLCYVVVVAGLGALMFWGVFKKAGIAPWLSMIPIVNVFPFMQVAGRPSWWGFLVFIPIVGTVVGIIACIDIARKFGKETGFAVALMFLGFIFFPILGFGDAKYDASL